MALCVISNFSFAETSNPNPLIEKLGYNHNSKLLIVHADDLGLNHSTNTAAITAFEKGYINSASIMVPAPSFDEIALFAKQNPQYDLGLHITMTSEWDNIKWGGISDTKNITSLLNEEGHFYKSSTEFAKHAKLAEVEFEFRAQIEHAIASGIQPTHLDSHMGSLFQNEQLLSLYIKMGREYKIPVVLPLNFISSTPSYMALLTHSEHPIDNYYILSSAHSDATAQEWGNKYNQFITQMAAPEVSQIVFHLGLNDENMQETTGQGFDWGARWRQQDFDYVSQPSFQQQLTPLGITKITWRDIQQATYPINKEL
jgi:predicted glycoside hydrolase/deacetylase ChbG (UPF0249 family)